MLIFLSERSKSFIVAGRPTALRSGRLVRGLVRYALRRGAKAFEGDALIVVESEYKGHWNKQPLKLNERPLCSDDKVQRLWEYLFSFLIAENLVGKHPRPAY